MSQEQIEKLQQAAAAHYLQGEFELALDSWRQLLTLSPEDERAQEGIRLCEMLAERDDAPEVASAPSAEDGPMAGLTDGDLAGLDDLFNEDSTPSVDASAPQDSEGMDSAFDFDPEAFDCDLPGGTPPPLPNAPLQNAMPNEGASSPVNVDPSPVTDELHTRINELLSEALTAHDKGDVDEALVVLERVFLLDEENIPAMALKNKLVISQQAAQDAASPSITEGNNLEFEDLGNLDLDVPEAVSAPETVTPPEDVVVAEPPQTVEEDTPPAEPQHTAVESRIAGFRANKPIVIAVVSAVVLIVAGFSMWNVFSAADTIPDTQPAAQVKQPEPTLPAQPAPVPEESVPDAPQLPAPPVSTVAPPIATISIDELNTQAARDFESGDYGQAVVAYDEVLKRDADNAVAQAGIALAIARYDEQKAFTEGLDKAMLAFDEQNYRDALYSLYRLPEGGDADTIKRYQLNAWFNLGVLALRASDCDGSRSPLDEAKVLAPDDPEIQRLFELAQDCKVLNRGAPYYDALRQIKLRAIDD